MREAMAKQTDKQVQQTSGRHPYKHDKRIDLNDMANKLQEIWISCRDNNGKMHTLTSMGWAKYQADRGNAANNKAKTISDRYKHRKVRNYSLRQVCGFEEISHVVEKKKLIILPEKERMINRFLRTKLVRG